VGFERIVTEPLQRLGWGVNRPTCLERVVLCYIRKVLVEPGHPIWFHPLWKELPGAMPDLFPD
jgi:hypothetical protein